jgi:hypothetical protein
MGRFFTFILFSLASLSSLGNGFEIVRNSMPTNRVALLVEWVNASQSDTNDTRLLDVLYAQGVSLIITRTIANTHTPIYEPVTIEFSELDKCRAVEHLLTIGADPNVIWNSETVLGKAIQTKAEKIVRLLTGYTWGDKLSSSSLESAYRFAKKQGDDLVCSRISQLINDKAVIKKYPTNEL